MLMTYHGLSCFQLLTKSASGQEQGIVLDVFEPKTAGLKSPRFKSEIYVTSQPGDPLHDQRMANRQGADSAHNYIDSPGEYEMRDIFIQALPGTGMTIVYHLDVEKIKIAFLGAIPAPELNPAQMELLEDSDMLILPVGGGPVLSAKQASELTKQLEPRLVIPCCYKTPGLKLNGLTNTAEDFFKELGIKPEYQEDKLRLTAKDLPQEELKVAWLNFK